MNNDLLFICGFPSSGTDLLKNIVNAHSDIYISGEFPLLPKIGNYCSSKISAAQIKEVISKLQELDIYNNFDNPNLDISKLEQKSEYSLSEIYISMLTNKQCVWKGNKTPQNTENIDKLKTLFPQAKFILIIRDIRDVCLSGQKKWGKDKKLWAAKWNKRMQEGYISIHSLDKSDFLIVKYENLLHNLDIEAQKICSFLNIDYQTSIINYHLNVKETIKGKHNYGKPLIKNNSEKWHQELSSKEIKRIEEIAFSSLQLFNYKISLATESKPISVFEKWYGLIHDLIAMFLVGNKAMKKSNTMRYRLGRIFFELQKRFS